MTIVVLAGLPGSGKSTWLQRSGFSAISSDEIRRLLADDPTDQTIHRRVFATMRFLIKQRLAVGRAVTYVDATHLTPRERRPYVQLARLNDCDVEALFFDVPLDVCLERNRLRDRVVPEAAIREMSKRLIRPTLDEGFSRVVIMESRY